MKLNRNWTPILLVVFALGAGATIAQFDGDALKIDPAGNALFSGKIDAPSADFTGNVTAGIFSGVGAVPKGAILMWVGNRPPKGWVVCDGKNGTPDLGGQFVVGYNPLDPDYNVITKRGGTKTHTLTIAEMPAHQHPVSGEVGIQLDRVAGIGGSPGLVNAGGIVGNVRGHVTFNTDTAAVGGGAPHENRPPYTVLTYIMFTGMTQ